MRAILGFLRRRIRQAGLGAGQGGAVAIVQGFGAALNVHALVPDGVFVEDGPGGVRFAALPVLDDEDVAEVLAALQRRVLQLLQRRGLADAPPHEHAVRHGADVSCGGKTQHLCCQQMCCIL
jgi:hypothetical protein